MSGALGALFTIVQFTVSKENRVFSNIFEIGMAGILSFVAVSVSCNVDGGC